MGAHVAVKVDTIRAAACVDGWPFSDISDTQKRACVRVRVGTAGHTPPPDETDDDVTRERWGQAFLYAGDF